MDLNDSQQEDDAKNQPPRLTKALWRAIREQEREEQALWDRR
jgi:hypothetical protein